MSEKPKVLKDIDPDMYDFLFKVRCGLNVGDEATVRNAIEGHPDAVYKIINGSALATLFALTDMTEEQQLRWIREEGRKDAKRRRDGSN